jgi:acetate CoA/acetoacetate CoA-transferase beta subunit
MDLLVGAKKVYVATDHVTRSGESKLLKQCTLPLTAKGVVDVVVTEMGYFEITPEGFLLKEIAPGVTVDEVKAATAGNLVIASDLKEMTA